MWRQRDTDGRRHALPGNWVEEIEKDRGETERHRGGKAHTARELGRGDRER